MTKCTMRNAQCRIGKAQNLVQFLIIASFLILCGCVHREFEYESSQTAYLDVEFDWANEPQANPGSMSLYLFPDEGGLPYRYDFAGRDGGTIRIAPGVYHTVCINSDEEDISFRGEESHYTFEVYMSESTTMAFGQFYSMRAAELPRAEGYEDQPLVPRPPMLWSTAKRGFKVDMQSSKSRDHNQRLVLQPKPIVEKYTVQVKDISNIQYLRAMNASVSDLADGYMLGAMAHNDNSTTLSFDLSHDAESASAEGVFNTFGHCAVSAKSHKLLLYAIMSDGHKYYFEFDVTDQMHDGGAIIIDGLDLPGPINGGHGGGFDPSVNDWDIVSVDLEM